MGDVVTLTTHKLVVFCGAQPNVKPVLLVTSNTGKPAVAVTVTICMLEQPVKRLVHTQVYIPTEPGNIGLVQTGFTPPGYIQQMLVFTVAEVMLPINVALPGAQLMITLCVFTVPVGVV